jgi:hypothetical protein
MCLTTEEIARENLGQGSHRMPVSNEDKAKKNYLQKHELRKWEGGKMYRVSIKSLPDYKHLLQENYVEYKHIYCTIFTNVL